MQDQQSSIRVICRFRPVNEREKSEEGKLANANESGIEFPDDFSIKITLPELSREPNVFTFDRVISNPRTSQEEVYKLTASETIKDVINGYNGTIFAYGQTGSGKSFTMFGPDISDPFFKGIIPRACGDIFEHIANDSAGTEYTIKCSFLEIYKEIVKDLLNPKGVNLKVRETPSRGVWVEGLTEQYVTSEEDVFNLLQLGEKFRAVSATNMNSVSSRSHSLFILSLQQKSADGSVKQGRLNLADLAGSEKVGKTGATGETLEEAKKINQSLSALGLCINALTKSKKTHVPYRDSKLTHILKESLGGNCKTTLLIACSPHKFNIEETVSTLKFGQRAKTIKNAVTQNKIRSVEELNMIISKLNIELDGLKKYISALERELSSVKSDFDATALKKSVIAESMKVQSTPEITSSSEDLKENSLRDSSSRRNSVASPVSSVPGSPSTLSRSPSPSLEPTPSLTFDSFSVVAAQLEMERQKEQHALQIQDLLEELDQATKAKEDVIKEKSEIQQQLDDAISQRNKIEEEKNHVMSILNQEISNAHFKLKQNEMDIEKHSELTKKLKNANEEIQSELTKYKEALANKTIQLERASQEKGKIERAYEGMQMSLDLSEAKVKELEGRISKMNVEQNELSSKQVELQATNKQLQERLHQLSEDLLSSQDSQVQINAQLSLKKSENENLEKLLQDAKLKVNKMEEELVIAQLEREKFLELEKELELTKSELVKLQSGSSVSDLSDKSELSEEGQMSVPALTKLDSASSLEAGLASLLKQRITILEQEYANEKVELQRALKSNEELKSAMETMQSQLAKHLDEIVNATSTTEKIRMEKHTLERRLNQEHKRLEVANERLRELTKELQEVKFARDDVVESLQTRLEEVLVKVEIESKQKKELEMNLQTVLGRMMSRDQAIQNLTDELAETRSDFEAISSEHKSLLADFEQKSQQVDKQQDEISRLNSKVAELMKQLEIEKKGKETMGKQYQEKLAIQEEFGRLSRKSGGKIVVPVAVEATIRASPYKKMFEASNIGVSPTAEPKKEGKKTKKDFKKIEKEGLLNIQLGGALGGAWKKFWCVLAEDSLWYFADKNAAEPVGSIQLDGCMVKDESSEIIANKRRNSFLTASLNVITNPFGGLKQENKKSNSTFILEHPTAGVFRLQASSQEEMDDWVIYVNMQIAVLREEIVRKYRGY